MSVANCINGRCFIAGGTFMMGSPEGVGNPDEHPQREITMSSFWMGQTEVSVGEYGKYLHSEFEKAVRHFDLARMFQLLGTALRADAGYCGEMNGKGGDFPVVCLTMQEKQDFCQAQDGDLSTAAQFEYAARSDAEDVGADKLVIYDNGYETMVPVTGGYQNRFGVYNLLGNVWEPTRDAYDENFYTRMSGTDPYNSLTNLYNWETGEGQLEEFRGGSFGVDRGSARAALRYYDDPDYRNVLVGLRCVWPALSEVEGPQDSAE